jgi:methionyl-tRNA formyltransferase
VKIIYVGLVDFSYHCLTEVIKNHGNVVGIITSRNQNNNADFKDLTPFSVKYKIPIFYCKNINSVETIDWIKQLVPDIIFCWGWSQIIQEDLINVAPMGIVGTHPSLLPKNRGRHPLIWAKFLGLKETGLTFFFMDKGVDSGNILSQSKFNIEEVDDAMSLYEKMKRSATVQIQEFLPKLINNDYNSLSQDTEKANYWRKRSCKDGLIDWRMSGDAIINLVRALTKPYVGAQAEYKEHTITIWKAYLCKIEGISHLEPGKILKTLNGKLIVKCYDCAILIEDYDPCINFDEGDYFL